MQDNNYYFKQTTLLTDLQSINHFKETSCYLLFSESLSKATRLNNCRILERTRFP